ncbi:MAG: response regulator [Armatimonadetes bacterium]|nr:response regulator [Armatimonadota bacterium]
MRELAADHLLRRGDQLVYVCLPEDLQVLYLSPNTWTILGSEPEELLQSFWDGVHPEDRERVSLWHRELAQGERLRMEFRFRCPDDSYGTFQAEIFRWEKHVSGLMRPHTPSWQVRTARLLRSINHELKTPMTGAVGIAELLLQTTLDGDQKGCLEILQQCHRNVLALMDNLLDAVELEAHILELSDRPFAVLPAAEEVISEAAPVASGKGLELVCRVSSRVPGSIRGDERRFRQLLANLVRHAVTRTSAGEVVMSLDRSGDDLQVVVCHTTRASTAAPGARAGAISGPPRFPPSQEELVLWVARSLTRRMGGEFYAEPGRLQCTLPLKAPRGQALPHRPVASGRRVLVVDPCSESSQALAEILSSLGAEVRTNHRWSAVRDVDLIVADERCLEGAPAGVPVIVLLSPAGSNEALLFPAAAQLPKPVLPSQLAALLNRPPFTELRRILVAEDNPGVRTFMARTLEKLGYVVELAENGSEALACFEPDRYHAVIMDCQMPVMDGFEATRQIREKEAGSRTWIIALTGSEEEGARERCLESGMDDYLIKPLKRATLEKLLESSCPLPVPSPAPVTPQDLPLDPGILEDLEALSGPGEPPVLEALYEIFVTKGPEARERIRSALDSSETELAAASAHSLKSTCASLGAVRMMSLCQKLESAARSGELDQASELATRIDAEYETVRLALRQRLEGTARKP